VRLVRQCEGRVGFVVVGVLLRHESSSCPRHGWASHAVAPWCHRSKTWRRTSGLGRDDRHFAPTPSHMRNCIRSCGGLSSELLRFHNSEEIREVSKSPTY
jgi:hypothetical protein